MATPTVLSYSYRDDDGVVASSPFYVSYNGAVETVDGLIGTWLQLGALLDAVSGARIDGGSVLIPLDRDDSWKSTAIVGQSVSDVLNLSFEDAVTRYATNLIVPALRDTLVAGGRPIMTAAGAIDTLRDLIIAGFTNGSFISKGADDLTLLLAAFQGVRKHRQQLKARSTVILP